MQLQYTNHYHRGSFARITRPGLDAGTTEPGHLYMPHTVLRGISEPYLANTFGPADYSAQDSAADSSASALTSLALRGVDPQALAIGAYQHRYLVADQSYVLPAMVFGNDAAQTFAQVIYPLPPADQASATTGSNDAAKPAPPEFVIDAGAVLGVMPVSDTPPIAGQEEAVQGDEAAPLAPPDLVIDDGAFVPGHRGPRAPDVGLEDGAVVGSELEGKLLDGKPLEGKYSKPIPCDLGAEDGYGKEDMAVDAPGAAAGQEGGAPVDLGLEAPIIIINDGDSASWDFGLEKPILVEDDGLYVWPEKPLAAEDEADTGADAYPGKPDVFVDDGAVVGDEWMFVKLPLEQDSVILDETAFLPDTRCPLPVEGKLDYSLPTCQLPVESTPTDPVPARAATDLSILGMPVHEDAGAPMLVACWF